MKRVLLIVSIVLLFVIFSAMLYSNYAEVRLKEYLGFIPNAIETFTGTEVKNFRLDRLIKKSPNEIIILVSWDNSSAFISIKGWLIPREHDQIRIRFFDNKHSILIME